MKKTYISLLVCLTVFSISLKADDVLYCTSELATGVLYENGKWATGDFENIRFTMKFNSDYTEVEYVLNDSGTKSAMSCERVYAYTANYLHRGDNDAN